ncbi:MAG: hypothetical protein IH624_19010 [Phycisphaerae bacterium]|nr:hypothetical protein [Phycisphaerae bacterium]
MLQDLFDGCLHIDPIEQTTDAVVQAPPPVPTCKGIVAFADADDRCISMLTAANIRRTVVARLFPAHAEQSGKRSTIAPLVRMIYYQCCYNDFAAALKYLHTARVLWPDEWRSMMSLPQLWFVKIDLSATWPNFSLTEKMNTAAARKMFGPFPTRKAAHRYITALRTAFALCHRPDLVDSPRKAAACPYLQMGTCPAPCVGNIARDTYHQQIEQAVAAAGGRYGDYAEPMRQEMMSCAADRQFERAALLKKRIEALGVLTDNDYAWTRDLSALAILHIDRWARVAPDGGKRRIQSYAGYLVVDGQIHCFEPFTTNAIAEFLNAAGGVLRASGNTGAPNATGENLALAASFLYRNNPPGIWIDCSAEESAHKTPPPEDVAARIQEKFTPVKTAGEGN